MTDNVDLIVRAILKAEGYAKGFDDLSDIGRKSVVEVAKVILAALAAKGLVIVPTDEIVRLRADLAEAREVVSDLQTFTFTVSADMDAELRARVRAWRDRWA